ncbi:MAG TPA: Gfo/Idh/MocA family oxidoreductase [Gemmatimonadales bacterium]|nr:Gfo/Idh/MocA family oxidoreductase [Gemmatimonadales bacterium]
MLDVGLVGFGLAGQVFHAPVIRAVAGLRLTGIVRRSGGADPRYPEVTFVRSVEELLAQPVDLVVVATPNPSHHPIAKQCLLADRHVVVDKPFTTTFAEAEELVELARERRRVLSVYQERRYTGDFVTVQNVVAEGTLGRVVGYEAHFDRFRPDVKPGAWREQALPGSGVWFDLGPHLLDQALLLFGTPEAVSADIRVERDGALVDDAFDVTLHYPGLRALLRGSLLAPPVAPSFALRGTRGAFVKYGLDPQEEALKSGGTPDQPDWDAEPPENYGRLITAEGSRTVPTMRSSFTRYYENIRDAILGTASPAVTPGQALEVMRGLELAARSSARGRVLDWGTAP